jgi:hypothetical protein
MKLDLTTKLAILPLAAVFALPFLNCGDDPDPASPTAGNSGSAGTGGSAGSTGGGGGSAGSAGTGGSAGVGGSGGSAGTGGSAPSPDAGPDGRNVVAEIRCNAPASDRNVAITPAANRQVYCAIDLGSNNAKLQVISMEMGQPLSFKDERQCRVRLGFGGMVYNGTTMVRSPLKDTEIANLIATMKEFQRVCALDKGTLVGAEATQWARDATNITDVSAMVKAATTLEIDVLTGEEEGAYGYVAATRNSPEKFSLDPGSNSFQIGWLPKGGTSARTVSVPLGYQRAADMFYSETTMDSYDVARAKHAAEVKTRLDAELAKLTPPTSLAALKADITAGNLKPEIFAVGQDSALHLSIKAQLRDMAGTWIDTQAGYDDRVSMERPMVNAMYGDITTVLTPADLSGFFTTVIKQADYDVLRSAKVRDIYGEKALANAVLIDTLVKELGLTTIVLVPQEMPAGYILASPLVK